MKNLLHHSIPNSAARYADRTAFKFGDQALSYVDLEARSNRLAWLLVENGVARGDRVGILLHKCIETPIAMYGIMKAGAAYVPLDPGAPAARVAATLGHCDVRCLITHAQKKASVAALLEAEHSIECVVGLGEVDRRGIRCFAWDSLAAAPGDRGPAVNCAEQDLAYIMYTSGSTGTPKGIMHTPASGLSYARMAADTYGITHHDRLGNHSPLHFDMSTLDYLASPLLGAQTVIIPEAYTRLPASLSQLIQDERLTIWYSVPFALIQLLLRGLLEQRDCRSLRWVLFGGEPFPPKYLQAVRQLWPQAAFSNVYGPAEVNQCTYYNIPPDAQLTDEPIPIGNIWHDVEGLVVDENDVAVGRNEPGELLIRAATMMRGYWNQPDLNASAFYRRPAVNGNSEVFYRTGDLVQQRDDGNLMFLGRKDRQVKTRGYRVELDEVEATLAAHGLVEEAAAYVIPGDDGGQLIEAAVVLKNDNGMAVRELHDYCLQKLPPYAVPADISLLRGFPRTTSGKIDRRALREQAMGGQTEVIGL